MNSETAQLNSFSWNTRFRSIIHQQLSPSLQPPTCHCTCTHSRAITNSTLFTTDTETQYSSPLKRQNLLKNKEAWSALEACVARNTNSNLSTYIFATRTHNCHICCKGQVVLAASCTHSPAHATNEINLRRIDWGTAQHSTT